MSATIKKATPLVFNAISQLGSKSGNTPKEIIQFIKAHSQNGLTKVMERCLQTAMKRGEQNGFLRAKRGRYSILVLPSSMSVSPRKKSGEGDDCQRQKRCRRMKGINRSSRRKSRCGTKRSSKSRRRSHSSSRKSRCRSIKRRLSRRRRSSTCRRSLSSRRRTRRSCRRSGSTRAIRRRCHSTRRTNRCRSKNRVSSKRRRRSVSRRRRSSKKCVGRTSRQKRRTVRRKSPCGVKTRSRRSTKQITNCTIGTQRAEETPANGNTGEMVLDESGANCDQTTS